MWRSAASGRLVCAALLVAGVGSGAYAASPPWQGSVECTLSVSEPGYQRQERQSWRLTGRELPPSGAMRVFEAEWVGDGRGTRVRGQGAQAVTTQWSVSIPATRVQFAVFVRASDRALIVQPWSSQSRIDLGLTGASQSASGQVTPIRSAAYEWRLPALQVDASSSAVREERAVHTEGVYAEVMPPSKLTPTADCRWNLYQGSTPAESGAAPSSSSGVADPFAAAPTSSAGATPAGAGSAPSPVTPPPPEDRLRTTPAGGPATLANRGASPGSSPERATVFVPLPASRTIVTQAIEVAGIWAPMPASRTIEVAALSIVGIYAPIPPSRVIEVPGIVVVGIDAPPATPSSP